MNLPVLIYYLPTLLFFIIVVVPLRVTDLHLRCYCCNDQCLMTPNLSSSILPNLGRCAICIGICANLDYLLIQFTLRPASSVTEQSAASGAVVLN